LCAALQIVQNIGQRGLEQEERTPLVAENLAAPRQADQVIVIEHAAMGVHHSTGDKGEDVVFVSQADEQGQVTGLGMGGGEVPGHGYF